MRGQAFDTFKLMIAAVIAVAILGILLGILRGITTGGISDPVAASQQLLKDAYYSGIKKAHPNPVTFSAGMIVPKEAIRKGSGIASDKLCLFSNVDELPAADDEVGPADSDITVKVTIDCTSASECQTGGVENGCDITFDYA